MVSLCRDEGVRDEASDEGWRDEGVGDFCEGSSEGSRVDPCEGASTGISGVRRRVVKIWLSCEAVLGAKGSIV
jgi:hypothetical protein